MKSTPDKPSDYWFPAKRKGWGWGLPSNWKGRAVLVAFYALVAASAVLFLPHHHTAEFVLCCVGLCLILVLVCYLTGEPPNWRAGAE